MFDENKINEIAKFAYTTPLSHLWLYARDQREFCEAKKALLFIIKNLLEGDHIRIKGKDGVWEDKLDKQIQRINEILPVNEIAMISNQLNDPVQRYEAASRSTKETLESIWFHTPDCNVKILWKTENGWEEGT